MSNVLVYHSSPFCAINFSFNMAFFFLQKKNGGRSNLFFITSSTWNKELKGIKDFLSSVDSNVLRK